MTAKSNEDIKEAIQIQRLEIKQHLKQLAKIREDIRELKSLDVKQF